MYPYRNRQALKFWSCIITIIICPKAKKEKRNYSSLPTSFGHASLSRAWTIGHRPVWSANAWYPWTNGRGHRPFEIHNFLSLLQKWKRIQPTFAPINEVLFSKINHIGKKYSERLGHIVDEFLIIVTVEPQRTETLCSVHKSYRKPNRDMRNWCQWVFVEIRSQITLGYWCHTLRRSHFLLLITYLFYFHKLNKDFLADRSTRESTCQFSVSTFLTSSTKELSSTKTTILEGGN